MIHSFTPSGVEHGVIYRDEVVVRWVIHSFTPSGVEHTTPKTVIEDPNLCDSFVYAVRR